MKFPISSYEKLLNNFLPKEFPEIDYIEVKKPSILELDVLLVKVYLKPADQQKGMISCVRLMQNIETRIKELSKYIGDGGLCSLDIYFEGELLCHDAFRM